MTARLIVVDVTSQAPPRRPTEGGRVMATPGVLVLADNVDEAKRLEQVGQLVRQVLASPSRPLPGGDALVQLGGRFEFVLVDLKLASGDLAVAIATHWEWHLVHCAGGLGGIDVLDVAAPRWLQ